MSASCKNAAMTLERLEKTPFSTVVRELIGDRRTGRMTVVTPKAGRLLFWSQGELVLAIPTAQDDSLGRYLARRGVIAQERIEALDPQDPVDIVPHLDEERAIPSAQKNSLLREWITVLTTPLFSLESGTIAFSDEEALEPQKRVFVSTSAVVLEGIRRISSGLVLRTSLGELNAEVQPSASPQFGLQTLPLSEAERKIAARLNDRMKLSDFLRSASDSSGAARVALALMTLGTWQTVEHASEQEFDETEKDLAILAAIGGDQKALQAVALARQLQNLDHYALLNVPRAATRQQIVLQGDELRRRFDPSVYPAAARDSVEQIRHRIDEAVHTLSSPNQRHDYDTLLSTRPEGTQHRSIHQQIARRGQAMQNFHKASELSIKGDVYGAILLLQQAVKFAPDHAESWHLLGVSQQKNPRWRRQAVDSLQRALSIDPNRVDTLIALGDIHNEQMMLTRARSFYEDVLKIDPGNKLALNRLKKMKT